MTPLYPVAEIFSSINGEGVLAGQLSVFVRFVGCNLRCSFCDTMWANSADAPHQSMTAEEIVSAVLATGIHNVTLTGGEPLLQPHLRELLCLLAAHPQLRMEIETNGSRDLSPYRDIPHVTFTMDYKLPYSGMNDQMLVENFAQLRSCDTVKFVIGTRADLEKAWLVAQEHSLLDRCHVYLSPVFGVIESADIVEFMKEHRWNGATMQLQLHKFIWDPNARGV
jgi:7-carboxy-7-deazaguanine synthase